jgi:DNA-binding IclR family transcriptional regulator
VVEAVGWVGRITPAYCTSAGQALLFDHDHEALKLLFEGTDMVARGPNTPTSLRALEKRLGEGREAGAALSSEQFESGLVAAAAPVRDATGAIVGVLNVSAPKFRVDGREQEIVAAVLAAAADVSQALAVDAPGAAPALVGADGRGS